MNIRAEVEQKTGNPTERKKKMDRLIVIDGNSVLNRAFYGIRELSAPDGTPTNAVYGFITTLKRYMDRLNPSYTVCTFDTKEKTSSLKPVMPGSVYRGGAGVAGTRDLSMPSSSISRSSPSFSAAPATGW